MNQQDSRWKTKELSHVFQGVRGAIPGAGLQLEVLHKVVSMWRATPAVILDLGCGDGVLGRTLLDAHKSARVIFADFSEPMLEAARRQIGINRQATVIKADFASPDWVKAVESEKHFDIIVSGFAIHHQRDDRKRELYAEIYGLLCNGGIFLNLDQVSSTTSSGSLLFDSFFLDHILSYVRETSPGGAEREVEEAYYQDKRENLPAPVETQCQWLSDIGFQDVDCFFKIFELALFGGRKVSTQTP